MKKIFILLFVISLLTSCQKIKPVTEQILTSSAVSLSIESSSESSSSEPQKTSVSSTVSKAVSSSKNVAPSSSTSVSSEETKKELTVSIKISGIDVVIYENSSAVITENMTVYQLTEKVCKENNILFKSNSRTGYITVIGSYEQKRNGIGWVYKLDGEQVNFGCNDPRAKLKGNEKIEWIFLA
jgi:hypothetical protein